MTDAAALDLFADRRSLNRRILLPMRFQFTTKQMNKTINIIAAAAAPPAIMPVELLELTSAGVGNGVCALLGVTSVSVAGTSTMIGGRGVITGAGVLVIGDGSGDNGVGVTLLTTAVVVDGGGAGCVGDELQGVLIIGGSVVKLDDGALSVDVQELPLTSVPGAVTALCNMLPLPSTKLYVLTDDLLTESVNRESNT